MNTRTKTKRKSGTRKSSRFQGKIPKQQRAQATSGGCNHQNPSRLPEIRLPENNRYLSEFGRELGLILSRQEVFRRFDKLVSPKQDEKGLIRLEELSSQEFRSLIEQYCSPFSLRATKTGVKKNYRSLPPEDSTATLVNRDLLRLVRGIRGFNQVSLPAYDGQGGLRLLPLGYDHEYQIYTVDNAFDYPRDISLKDARNFFDGLLSEFCFLPGDRERATSVIIAAGLTLYAVHLLPQYCIRPIFLISGNSEGSGKTLLCKIPIIAILGNAPAGTIPKDEDEMRKLIAAAALGSSPTFFLDNVKGHLSSPSLESLATSPVIKFRTLGKTKMQEAEHGLTVFITANQATFSPDLRRRTLIIELFLEEVRAENRLIINPLHDAGIIQVRAKILGSFWALVREWERAGCPFAKQINQSFVAWNKVIGGIMETAGYVSPTQFVATASGDVELLEMEKLVNEMVLGAAYDFAQLVDLARHHRLFEWVVGNTGDPDLEPKSRSMFGKLLKRFIDRIFPGKMRFVLLSTTARKLYGIQQI
jgi:hypothetical protein